MIKLRNILQDKALASYFRCIFGSPKSKSNILSQIIGELDESALVVMIGDSIADFNVAVENSIDFIGITGYSNRPTELKKLCQSYNKKCIDHWGEIHHE